MTNCEKKIFDFCIKNISLLAVIFFSLLKLFLFLCLKTFISLDMSGCLLPWFETIQENGGFRGLAQQVGNYGILYQTLIALMTYIPINSVTLYKLLSLAFDFLMGAAGGLVIWETEGRNRTAFSKAAIAYCAIIISPIVQMNSAIWGQCDSIYTFFAIMAVYFLWKEKYFMSFLCLGISFAFKLQAIFILPAFIIWYVKTKKFSALHFFLIPFAMICTAIPGLLMGRSIKDVFSVFIDQVDYYHYTYVNCGVLGALISDNGDYYNFIAPILIGVCCLALFILLAIVLMDERKITFQQLLEISFLSTYICFLLLPNMHERYGYPAEILGIIIAFFNIKTIPLLIIMSGITAMTYGHFLFELHIDSYPLLGMINVIVLVLYAIFCLSGKYHLVEVENNA